MQNWNLPVLEQEREGKMCCEKTVVRRMVFKRGSKKSAGGEMRILLSKKFTKPPNPQADRTQEAPSFNSRPVFQFSISQL